MNLAPIKYKNYVWHHNPEKLDITIDRNLKEVEIPFSGSIFQDYGRKKRIVKGSGKFFGNNSVPQYEGLLDVFKQKESGYLSIPNVPSFLAFFKALNIVQSDAPNVINYTFEFWEDTGAVFSEKNLKEHTVLLNETLWDIALSSGVNIDTLISLNENIKNPNELTAGEKVVLS